MLARCDDAVGDLVRAAGGLDEFLERYAVIVMSDHGQTPVRDVARLGDRFRHVADTLVAASNRAAHVYRDGAGARRRARTLAERLDGEPSVEVVLFREDGVDGRAPRRSGAPAPRRRPAGIALEGDPADPRPAGRGRRAPPAALRCPNAGDVVVSAADGLGVRGPRRPHITAAAARTARSPRATRSFPS